LPIGTTLIAALLKEESHALQPRRTLFVLNQAAAKPLALKQLWEALPQPNRQQTLQTLSRLIAQQLQPLPGEKEVDDEDR
jgi:hypothetical protein